MKPIFAGLGVVFTFAAGVLAQTYTISTVAGGGVGDGGTATTTRINPQGVAVDSAGNLYIADSGNNRVLKVTAGTGAITTVAGRNIRTGFNGDGGAATTATFNLPYGVAVDTFGNLYITDFYNNRVRKVAADTGIITTIAGNGNPGFSGDGGRATDATLSHPANIAVDSSGNIYFSDYLNCRVRKVSASTSIITTVAGKGCPSFGSPLFSGDGGPATEAVINAPQGLAFDASGNLYVADTDSQRIRRVAAGTGIIATVAGNGSPGFSGDGGTATGAALFQPADVAVDAAGNLYIADTFNCRVRKVAAVTGIITSLAGNAPSSCPVIAGIGAGAAAAQSGNIAGTSVSLNHPAGVAVDLAGNVYIADRGNNVVRKIAADTGGINTVAGTGFFGYAGDNGLATNATLAYPFGVTADSAGNIYITDTGNRRVRRVAASTGLITTVTPSGALTYPAPVTADTAGNLYISDSATSTILKLTISTGTITTVAGTGTAGFSGDGAAAVNASITYPESFALDASGNLFFADGNNNRIRKIAAGTGVITTVAGNGTAGFSGDGASALNASLSTPTGIAVDSSGNLLIGDNGNNRVRKVAAGTGLITTIAGNGTYLSSGDGGAAINAGLDPTFLLVDSSGNLYVADKASIRKIAASTGIITTIAGTGVPGFSGDGGPAASAQFSGSETLAFDTLGNILVADFGNDRIRKLTAMFPVSVATNPAGLNLTVDGVVGAAPQSLSWAAGSNHTLFAPDQTASSGLRYTFSSWSQGGPASQTVTAGAATYTANFTLLPPTAICPSASLAEGVNSSIQCTASGGVAPWKWSVTAGSLPPGMQLNSSTGVISGLPTTGGQINFTLTATDSNTPSLSATATVSIQISSPPAGNSTIYSFAFSPTSITQPTTIVYSGPSLTPPGTSPLNAGTQWNASRGVDGTWTFSTPYDSNTVLSGGAFISSTRVVSTNTSFSNVPGIYPGVPAKVTVTCLGAGSACLANFRGLEVGTVFGTVTITIQGGAGPDLAISSTHSGAFAQNQNGQYALAVRNVGSAPASGTVTVVENPPGGLTLTAISGSGWTCDLNSASCTRSDGLEAGAGYPAISVTVKVASTAAASLTNSATVAGGGETNTSNDTGSDLTTVTTVADLVVGLWHPTNFYQGQSGASTFIDVGNAGASASSGLVTVTEAPPAGMTVTSLVGPGWTCVLASLACSRSDALAGGGHYPPVVAKFSVDQNAPSALINSANVAGGAEINTGNDAATDNIAVASVVSAITFTAPADPLRFGQPVTLTTNVLPAGATGTVTFYDGVTLLGAVPLVAGEAALTTRMLPSGARSLRARYNGSATIAPASSITLSRVVNVLPSKGFRPRVASAAGPTAWTAAASDLNGDGFIDLAVAHSFEEGMHILLGRGDGTFQDALRPSAGSSLSSVTTGDFNGDGKPDLAATEIDGTVYIFLGEGDGTFPVTHTYPAARWSSGGTGIVSGDFNGDGAADLAVTSSSQVGDAGLFIMLGNGDGTFQSAQNYAPGMITPAIALADFNGDGVTDMVIADPNGGGIAVLTGNGDGTFQAPVRFAGGGPLAFSIATGDLNGDGKTDVVMGRSTGQVDVFLGNGDGSFHPMVEYAVGDPSAAAVGIADLNGDGKADIALVSGFAGNVAVLAGRGDGTFQAAQTYPGTNYLSWLTVADFNGDGAADLAVIDIGGETTVSVLLGTSAVLTSVSPSSVTVQSPSTAVTLSGSYFTAGSTVYFTPPGGTATSIGTIAADQLNGAQFVATIPAGLLASPGTAFVSMRSAAGVLSNSLPFTISPPPPAISSISPSAAVQFSAAVSIAVRGTNFAQAAVVNFQPPGGPVSRLTTNFIQDSQLAASIPAAFMTSAGTAVVTVQNGSGTASNRISFPIIPAPAPVLTSVTPNASPQFGGPTQVTINGSNFINASLVYFTPPGGVPVVVPSLIQSAQLLATIPGALLTTAGTAQIAVQNGAGTPQPALPFTISPPALTAVAPNSVTAYGPATPVTVTGSNFGPGAVLSYTPPNGGPPLLISPTLVEMAKLRATVPAAYLTTAGAAQVAVQNGPGGLSTQTTFTVTAATSSSTGLTVSGVNPGILGQPLTLTATVAPAPGYGSVTFYSGVTVLGTSPISAGTATLITSLLPTGANPLRAHFLGADGIAPSGSAVTVRTVQAIPGFGLASPVKFAAGNRPDSVVIGDLNGDGKSDAVLCNFFDSSISILLGNGDGTFQAPVSYATGSGPYAAVIGDFNGDGNADVALADNNGNVVVFPGKGNGTLLTPPLVTNRTASQTTAPQSVAMSDFDGDGRADLVITNTAGGVSILLGNGDGTFRAPLNLTTGTSLSSVGVGDFNGDGKVDLVVSDFTNSVTILLGNGDGTFHQGAGYPAGNYPAAVTSGDFNQDGKVDLAVASRSGVSVLLGKGDGTFEPAQSLISSIGNAFSVAAADFKGDGRQDIVAGAPGNVLAFPGKGDGTFQNATIYGIGEGLPVQMAVGDFNRDGRSDLVVVDFYGSSISVLLGLGSPQMIIFPAPGNHGLADSPVSLTTTASSGLPVIFASNSPAVCTVSGSLVTLIAAGTCSITATQGGNATYAPAALTRLFTIDTGWLTAISPSSALVGSAAAAVAITGTNLSTATTLKFTPPGGTPVNVTLSLIQTAQAAATLPGALLTSAGTAQVALADASGVITNVLPFLITPFSISGVTPNTAPRNSPDTSVSVSGQNLATATGLKFTAPDGSTAQLALALVRNAQVSATIPAAWMTTPGTAQIALINSAGALSGQLPFTIGDGTSQTISFGPISSITVPTGPFGVAATASSGLPVMLASNTPAVCVLQGNTVTVLTSGGCSIAATQPGNAVYAPAASVTQSFTIVFADVSTGDYFSTGINLLAQKGITAGCGNNGYCPGQVVTRAQMAIFMVRAIDGGDDFTYSPTPWFGDVPQNAFGFRWIQRLKELGITAGCGGGNYCPNVVVTRDQMAIFLTRLRLGVNLAGANPAFTYPATPFFTDVPSSNPAFAWIQRLKLDSITAGCTATSFCPNGPVIRGDMAIFIMRGAFNQLLPAGTPVVTQIAPTSLAAGSSGTFTITGLNTNFVQGTTQLSPLPGITLGTLTVNSPTSLTVQLTAGVSAETKPYSILAITGLEQAVLPNGLTLQ